MRSNGSVTISARNGAIWNSATWCGENWAALSG